MTLTAHPPARIPRSLDRRPKWKDRYPIPYVMAVDARGVPDFRVNDEEKRDETIRRRLCALCGEKLPPNWSALIGGPLCAEYRLFMDGPMHEACARYAFTICPYLAAPNANHASLDTIDNRWQADERTVAVEERIGGERPERMGLFFARTWTLRRLRGQPSVYFFIPEFARQEWYP